MRRWPDVVIFIFLIVLIFSSSFAHCQTSTNWYLCNYDFTNKEMSRSQFQILYNHQFSAFEIDYIYTTFSNRDLNPLLFELVRRKEGMTNKHYFYLACGIHLKDHEGYRYFGQQVAACANTLRNHYDRAEGNGYSVYIFDLKRNVTAFNKATYSLMRYTPYHKMWLKGRGYYVGNWILAGMWREINKNSWDTIRKSEEYQRSCFEAPDYYGEE